MFNVAGGGYKIQILTSRSGPREAAMQIHGDKIYELALFCCITLSIMVVLKG